MITVAPQKDIWPHGKTYPKKETPIKTKSKTTPESQVVTGEKALKYNPREMCKNKRKNKKEAPLACRTRIIQP